MIRNLKVWGLVVPFCLMAQVCFGQLLGRKPDTEFVPKDAFVAGVIFPQAMAEDEKFELIPREIITAWGMQEFGFDPMKIEQATFVVKSVDSLNQGPPQWAAALRFTEMQGLSNELLERLDRKKLKGNTLYSANGRGPSFLVFDESTMIVGEEEFMESLLEGGEGDLADLIKESKLRGDAFGFVAMEGIRDAINEQIAQMEGMMLPPPLERMKGLPELIVGLELAVNMSEGFETKLIIHADDEEDAEEVKEILEGGMDFGKQMILAQTVMEMDTTDPMQEASARYIRRLIDSYEQKLEPRLEGKQLVIELKNETAVAPVLIGMLLPAVQQVRSAARRTDSANRVRQFTLAMHNYADTYGGLPAQANYDEDGKPLLSWRVHVLPFIEQQELYDQFHLDEPWDSPHNIKLVDQMPEIYLSPDAGDLGGKTIFLGVAGEGMAMGKEKTKFSQFLDGTSNTILMVEVDPNRAVEWTKPEDFEPDEDNPMRGLGGVRPSGFNAAFADGSVQFLSRDLDPETLKAMFTIDGSEVINR